MSASNWTWTGSPRGHRQNRISRKLDRRNLERHDRLQYDDMMSNTQRPNYVYVASSWRNTMQPALCAILAAAKIPHYDFRNPEGGTGFSWREVKSDYDGPRIGTDGIRPKGSDWEPVDEYLNMVAHPRAEEGFASDFDAMKRADAFIMVLPCGKSAHLELGWAAGHGKRTAILLEDPMEPELMYKMVDFMTPSVHELLGWLGVED